MTTKYDRTREERAKIILSREHAITKVSIGVFTVQSQTGIGSYRVDAHPDHFICNCPDFTKNGTMRPCKHILAVRMYLGIDAANIDVAAPLTPSKSYSQPWSHYNHSQATEIEMFDQFLYQLVSDIEDPEQKTGRPHHPRKELLFCCIMKAYSQLSSRRAQCLFHQALQRSQINHDIHYNALSRTLLNNEMTPILRQLVRFSALPLAGIETQFAIDSSGFRCSSFGQYCEQKHGTKRMHNWLKVHICTGIKTNIVADAIITDENSNDSPQFEPLLKEMSAQGFNIEEISADKAYSSRKNYEIAGQIGAKAYIPFKENATGEAKGSPLWRKAYYYFQLHKEEFEAHYHKRSNVESTFAAIKKKFGETIKSKDRIAQENEMLCKIIAYNITILIKESMTFGRGVEFNS